MSHVVIFSALLVFDHCIQVLHALVLVYVAVIFDRVKVARLAEHAASAGHCVARLPITHGSFASELGFHLGRVLGQQLVGGRVRAAVSCYWLVACCLLALHGET